MGDRRRSGLGHICVLWIAGLALAACGADPAPGGEPPRFEGVEIPSVEDLPDAETADEFETAPDAATARSQRADDRPASGPTEVAPRVEQQDLDQPAIWPASDVVFATPEAAAADFVSAVLISEGDPVLGEFQQGDARSGEIAVLFPGEAGDLDPPLESGLLLLRQIGPTDGWYVIAATSAGVMIDTPSALDGIPPGPVTVSGEGRGFEGTMVVSAFSPGDADARFDLQIGAGGAFEELEAYSVALDLSRAADGEVVVILVRGDTGLANHPSTFAAIPVVITSAIIPPTK